MNTTDLRELLAANFAAALRRLERRLGEKLTHEQIAARAGIGKGTVGRLTRKESCPAVDTLESLAAIFGLRGWQLLIEGFRADEPPEIMTEDTRLELAELRALAQQVEELKRGRSNTGAGYGDAGHSQSIRPEQTRGRKKRGTARPAKPKN